MPLRDHCAPFSGILGQICCASKKDRFNPSLHRLDRQAGSLRWGDAKEVVEARFFIRWTAKAASNSSKKNKA